jgi:hypothetical protein
MLLSLLHCIYGLESIKGDEAPNNIKTSRYFVDLGIIEEIS